MTNFQSPQNIGVKWITRRRANPFWPVQELQPAVPREEAADGWRWRWRKGACLKYLKPVFHPDPFIIPLPYTLPLPESIYISKMWDRLLNVSSGLPTSPSSPGINVPKILRHRCQLFDRGNKYICRHKAACRRAWLNKAAFDISKRIRLVWFLNPANWRRLLRDWQKQRAISTRSRRDARRPRASLQNDVKSFKKRSKLCLRLPRADAVRRRRASPLCCFHYEINKLNHFRVGDRRFASVDHL